MAIKNPKIRKLKNIVIRIAIVVVAYLALYLQLRKQGPIDTLWERFASQFYPGQNNYLLVLAIALMGLNWSLEALKWRFLIRKTEHITFLRSLKAIFTGISVGTFTPNRLGEFLGRSFILDQTHPWKVFFMTIIGSYSQLLATILFGGTGLIFFTWQYAWFPTGFTYLDALIAFFSFITAAFLILLYFNIDIVDKYLGNWIRKRQPRFASRLHIIAAYSTCELLHVLFFSLSRYAVFSIQFFLLMRFFGLIIPFWHTMIFTSVTYLVVSVIPSIALSEIGVRGSVALFFFSFYFQSHGMDHHTDLTVVSTSTMLWLINIFIPAILGTFFVYHLKVFRNGKTSRL